MSSPEVPFDPFAGPKPAVERYVQAIEVTGELTGRQEVAAGDLGGLVLYGSSALETQSQPDTAAALNAPMERSGNPNPQETINEVNSAYNALRGERNRLQQEIDVANASGDTALARQLRADKDAVLAQMTENSRAHKAALRERRTSGANRSTVTSSASSSMASIINGAEYPDRISGYSL